jgi:hypothetical protein
MSDTMARQGGLWQLKQSHMHLASNIMKIATGGLLRTPMQKKQYVIKKPRSKVRDEKKQAVQYPGYEKVKTAIDNHLAIFPQNHMAGFLPCQNGTVQNTQKGWRHNGSDSRPPDRRRQPTPHLTLPLPTTPSAPTGNNSGAKYSQIVILPVEYCYSHRSLPCA